MNGFQRGVASQCEVGVGGDGRTSEGIRVPQSRR